MAKAKKKTGSAAQPVAALFHLDAGTPRGDAVRAVLSACGVRAKTVAPERLGDAVGAIMGLPGFRPGRTAYTGTIPEGEFMLLGNLSPAQTNTLLAAMREADCSVGCKAQVTQHNRLWPFATLVEEVTREHNAMTGQGQS